MDKLVILGKAVDEIEVESDVDIWTLGTHDFAKADKYFEFHGKRTDHDEKKVIRNVPQSVIDNSNLYGIPLNNSITIMALWAWILGYRNISIVGCPMIATEEYLEQKPALAFAVGFLKGKGVNITWDGLPENTMYGVNK